MLVVGLAFYQTRRITRPIRILADASRAGVAGKTDRRLKILANNEIGQLADTFNHVLKVREKQDKTLQKNNEQIQKALDTLTDVQFALDQHAITAITERKIAEEKLLTQKNIMKH